jgi:predicted TPR repeat methyltransferase
VSGKGLLKMPKEDWTNNPIDVILKQWWPSGVETVLDVGCGLSLKSQYISGIKHIVGVDIYEPYLRTIRCSVPYSVVRHDVRELKKIFIDNSFDLVIALDIIEHLNNQEAIQMICDCKDIAKKAVVVETPEGYIPQNVDIQGFGNHKYQTHRSGWSISSLECLGFKCITRPYKMCDVKRHTDHIVESDINLIDGIWICE